MFTIDNSSITYDVKENWIPDQKVNGVMFATPPRDVQTYQKGSVLISQYLESLRYRLVGCQQLAGASRYRIYNVAIEMGFGVHGDYISLKNLMTASLQTGYINDTKIRWCNDILTLKWFMHEYKQCLVELRKTSTTSNPSDFTIASVGVDVNDGRSIGYMMYGYDTSHVILQGVNGLNSGCAGFYRIPWDVFTNLFIKGVVFGLP